MSPDRSGVEANALKESVHKTPVTKQAQTESRHNKNIIENSLTKNSKYLNSNISMASKNDDDKKYANPYFGSVHAKGSKGKFDIDNDPDRPEDAINMSVIVEEIDINGNIQKV